MKALIIIDMVVRDVNKRKDKDRLISNQLRLINVFKKNKQKVIIVGGAKDGKDKGTKNPVMLRLWKNEILKDPDKNKVIPELLDSKYDYYIDKSEYSAFFKTDLEKICKNNKITELYLAGIYSGVCIYFTAADAAMRGIFPVLVTDASGAPSLKTHKQNIKKFKEVLGETLTTNEVIKRLKLNRGK